MEEQFTKLCAAIGYPQDDVFQDGNAFVLKVDGEDIRVLVQSNRYVFSCIIAREEEDSSILATLAEYATGRILKEEAVLAWDETEDAVILWQDVPLNASSASLRRVFELFLTSCDWWLSRVQNDSVVSSFPEMMIRP